MAPFREFLALVILDGDFDLPQHLSVDPAHRRAQLGGGFRGVEIEDAQEILMLEAVVRFKPAAGHERVGNADGGGVTAAPATYFSAASEETIFSAAVHIRS